MRFVMQLATQHSSRAGIIWHVHRYQTGLVRLQTESLTWATSQPAAVGAHAAPVRPVGPGSSGIEAPSSR